MESRIQGSNAAAGPGHGAKGRRAPKVHHHAQGVPVRIVHLHGIISGKDHRGLAALDAGLLARLVARLSGDGAADRIVSLEVFSRADFEESLAIMERLA